MRVELKNLVKQFGDLVAVDDVSMMIEDGEFVSLVGPSGCGKTTTLRCIVGLEQPTSGRIVFDGADVTGLSPQDRNVAMVFQNYALYPHMTARKNMSFALRDAGLPKEEIENRIGETTEMLGIRDHLEKKPEELSGGQKQRVALGRSLVRDPDVFLLDEPLSNLDAKLRIQMRAELQKIHRDYGTTTIYVTHDQEEAMTMSDRIAILNKGRLQQFSTPEAAYSRPNNRFVAGFIGSPSMNFIPCEYSNQLVTEPFSLDLPQSIERAEDATEVGIRPENILLSRDGAQTMGTVNVFERLGSYNIVYVQPEGYDDEITVQTPADERYEPGEQVGLSVVGNRFHVFAADGETIYSPEPGAEKEMAGERV